MQFCATDPDAAAAALADEYTDVTIRASRGRPFGMQLSAFPLPQMRYGELSFSESQVLTRAYPSYNLCVPVGGSLIATADDTDDVVHGTDLVMISPGSRIDARYPGEGVVLRTVQFDTELAVAELSALLGRPVATPPRFDFAVRSTSSAAIRRAVGLLDGELRTSSPIADEPVLVDRLSRMIVSALLLGQPHSGSAELHGRPYVEGPRAIRSLLRPGRSRPHGIRHGRGSRRGRRPQRARPAGRLPASRRAFPMQYLRQARLTKAHEALRAADSMGATATAVAHSWGFAHYGRFAAEYRERP